MRVVSFPNSAPPKRSASFDGRVGERSGPLRRICFVDTATRPTRRRCPSGVSHTTAADHQEREQHERDGAHVGKIEAGGLRVARPGQEDDQQDHLHRAAGHAGEPDAPRRDRELHALLLAGSAAAVPSRRRWRA